MYEEKYSDFKKNGELRMKYLIRFHTADFLTETIILMMVHYNFQAFLIMTSKYASWSMEADTPT